MRFSFEGASPLWDDMLVRSVMLDSYGQKGLEKERNVGFVVSRLRAFAIVIPAGGRLNSARVGDGCPNESGRTRLGPPPPAIQNVGHRHVAPYDVRTSEIPPWPRKPLHGRMPGFRRGGRHRWHGRLS